MTDAEYQRARDTVDERLLFWIPRMGLGHWERVITHYRHPASHEIAQPDGFQTPFQIMVNWQYLQFSLDVFASAIWDCYVSDGRFHMEKLDKAIVHELFHPHMAELRVFVPATESDVHILHEERVVSTCAMIVSGLYTELDAWDRKQESRIKRLTREIVQLKAGNVDAA